ncbi:MAG: deoxyribonuclease [Isosphaeraceae bacterium]|jgi:TatD DNase family protein|nr:MAG: deoxyribonuclease [Isosphaeraceae bacterium]
MLQPCLVDTHAHLADASLRFELDAILRNAAAAGVRQILTVATTAADSADALDLASRHRGLFASVGIQPNLVAQSAPDDWNTITRLALQPRVRALGETGLDRYWDHTPFDQQRVFFDRHIELAEQLDLPLVIHCRNCESEIVAQLSRLGRPVRGVLHSFTGTAADAEEFLALGLHISFAGMVTFPGRKNDPLREVARRIPDDRLLIETDSPYLSPHPLRGRFPNEPARLIHTAERIAALRDLAPTELAQITTRNAQRLFALDPADSLADPPDPLAPSSA